MQRRSSRPPDGPRVRSGRGMLQPPTFIRAFPVDAARSARVFRLAVHAVLVCIILRLRPDERCRASMLRARRWWFASGSGHHPRWRNHDSAARRPGVRLRVRLYPSSQRPDARGQSARRRHADRRLRRPADPQQRRSSSRASASRAVGQVGTLAVPAGAEVISTEGMTVLPGLWDMHVHLMINGHTDYDALGQDLSAAVRDGDHAGVGEAAADGRRDERARSRRAARGRASPCAIAINAGKIPGADALRLGPVHPARAVSRHRGVPLGRQRARTTRARRCASWPTPASTSSS